MECTIVFRDSCVTLPSQEQLEGCPIHHIPLAVHVPVNPEEIVPEGAFAGVPRLRHVSVESGIRLIGAEAWQNCRQLRKVKLPATVVGISDNVFRNCKLLNSVLASGVSRVWISSPRGSAPQPTTNKLTPDCLSTTGITALALTKHFVAIGAHACDRCRLLKSVDLCNTKVEEIPEFTFVRCTSLREVLLPKTLHTIRVKAFMNCAALLSLPSRSH